MKIYWTLHKKNFEWWKWWNLIDFNENIFSKILIEKEKIKILRNLIKILTISKIVPKFDPQTRKKCATRWLTREMSSRSSMYDDKPPIDTNKLRKPERVVYFANLKELSNNLVHFAVKPATLVIDVIVFFIHDILLRVHTCFRGP